jgi:uncharacterized protein YjdB
MSKHNISFKRFVLSLIFMSAIVLMITGCKPKSEVVPVDSVSISGLNNATTISTIGGTLQFSAIVLPEDADDKSVVWSVINGTGQATISANGLLTAVANGTVTVKAVANDDVTVFATKVVTISNQEVLAASITVSSAGNAVVIDTFGGTLQFTANVLPANTANKAVVWSVQNGTGEATISAAGLLSAVKNGTVTVKAQSSTSALVYGEMLVTLSNQDVLISSISVNGAGSASTITTFRGTLQMSAEFLPVNADNKSIIWSVEQGTGEATINQSGLLTAVADGTVIVKATSVNQPLISGTRTITISNQVIVVTSIELTSAGNAVAISTFGGTLQFTANPLPTNALDKAVVWSVINGTGQATINQDGLLTAVSNGTVTVKVAAANDPTVSKTMVITLSNQDVLVSSITMQSAGNVVVIDTFGGTLQFTANVLPIDAANKAVVWSVINGTGTATISAGGLLSAVSNGTVTVKVAAQSNAAISATMIITLSNQEVLVTSIAVSGFGDAQAISTFGGTLQMLANVLPLNAADKSVVWSVEAGTGEATINQDGLLTAVSNGTVIVKATSVSQPLISGSRTITISNQEVLAASVEVNSAGDVAIIDTFGGTLQFSAIVLPLDAVDKTVIWSVSNGTGEATIDQNGLLTAVSNGTVIVKAAATNNALIFDTFEVTLSNQEVLATSVELSSALDAVIIDTFGGTLQFTAVLLPTDAENKTVVWSVLDGTGSATIDQNGLLTAVSNGTVTVKVEAESDALIFDTMEITLSNQDVLVASINVKGTDDVSFISAFGGTLLMIAEILPIDAVDQTVVWSVENVTGEATIDQDGVLTAVADGTVIVKATSTSNVEIFGTKEITITEQTVIIVPEPKVELLTAGDFTILAKTGISTAADSLIVGNMGVSPVAATYITGFSLILDSTTQFSTSAQVVGMIYAADYSEPTPHYLTQAVSDMEAAYTDAASRAPDFTELYAGDLSGQTLVGGVYKYGTDVVVYSNLTLSGSADDVWIFQISGNFTQAVSVQMILTGGAVAENVFWQIAGSVAIETSAHFSGIILSMTEISLGTNATVSGKLLSQTAVTLDANTVSLAKVINVESIVVSSEADLDMIDTFGGTLQMYAEVMPLDATNQAVLWSVENVSGEATIDENGLLTAVADGTVLVKATSATNELLFDTLEVVLSNQAVLVESVTVFADGEAVIDTYGGTLQMLANVLPNDAENKDVVWSVENVSGDATIDAAGLLTAIANGVVTVKATSVENGLIFGTLDVTISNQEILVESIAISSENDAIIIDVLEGTLQMYAEILPEDAANQAVLWSVENGTGSATIDQAGLLTAVSNGTVLVKATSAENVLIFATLEITLSNQAEVIVSNNVALGTAEDFVILSKTGISSTAGTLITGNIGVSPGPASYITGFGLVLDASGEFATSTLVIGMVYAADLAVPTPSYLSTAVSDMETAYTDAAGRATDFVELYAGDISGQTLVPGVYYWSSGLLINSDVILSGNATDVWIFQIAGTLTQATDVSILLEGGALASNIVWQVAAAVSIGVGAHFEGTILGMTSVSLGTNASLNGRIFAQTAVMLDSNKIN